MSEVKHVKTVSSDKGGLTLHKHMEKNPDFLRRGFSKDKAQADFKELLENPQSWITDTFIDHEVNKVIDGLGGNTNIEYLSPSVFAFIKDGKNDTLEENQVKLKQTNGPYLVPLNLDSNHWILLKIYVSKGSAAQYLYITIYDSLNGEKEAGYYEKHRDVSRMVRWFVSNYPPAKGLQIFYLIGIAEQQNDQHNCGLWVILNATRILVGKEPGDESSDYADRFREKLRKDYGFSLKTPAKPPSRSRKVAKEEEEEEEEKEEEEEAVPKGIEGKLQQVDRWVREVFQQAMVSGEELVVSSEADLKRKNSRELKAEQEKKQKKIVIEFKGEPLVVEGGSLDHQEEPLLNLPGDDWAQKVKLIDPETLRQPKKIEESLLASRQIYLTRRFLDKAKEKSAASYALITSVIVAVLSNDAFRLMVLMDSEIYHSREDKALPMRPVLTKDGPQFLLRKPPKSPYWDIIKWSPSEVVVVAARYNCYYVVLAMIKLYLDGRVLNGGVVTRDRPELAECDFDLFYGDGLALRLACECGGYETVLILLRPLGWKLEVVGASRTRSYLSSRLGYRARKQRMVMGVGLGVFEGCLRVLEKREGREERGGFRDRLREECVGELTRVAGVVKGELARMRR